MKKLLTIAFIGISCAFLGTSKSFAGDGNGNDINWTGIDYSTSVNSAAVTFVGRGKYCVYSVIIPTVAITAYVDVFDATTAVNATMASGNWVARIYNSPVAITTGALVDSAGVAVMSNIKELRYPIRLDTGFAWQTSYTLNTITSVGFNKRSNP